MQINLLPWREEMRRMKKTQFLTALIACCLLSLFILLVFHLRYSSIARHQNRLNTMLSTEINNEQGILNQIGSKASEAVATETQLKFIIGLYNDNYRAVRLLNDLVSLISSNISLDEIKRNGNQVNLSGIAKTEDDVTLLMKEIEKSPYFNQPVLLSINTGKNEEATSRNFNIMFEQTGS